MNVENEKGWKEKLFREFITFWMYAIYLAVMFSVFTNYRRLILAHYEIAYEDYGISVIKGLVLAKVIMVADALGLGRGLEHKPLYIPTLYKTLVFTVFVSLFTVIESMVRSLIGGKGPFGEFSSLFTYEWLAGGLVVFFTFIPFFAFRELGSILGRGNIARLFFRKRDAALIGIAGSAPPREGGGTGDASDT